MQGYSNPSKLLYDFVKKILDEKRIEEDKKFVVIMGNITGLSGGTNLIRILNKEGMESVLKYQF